MLTNPFLNSVLNKSHPKIRREFDTGGLAGMYAEISPKGKISFYQKYHFDSVETRIKLGEYPAISISEARMRGTSAKQLVSEGIDPKQDVKRKQTEAEALKNNFKPSLTFVIDTYLAKESVNHKGHKWNFNRLEKFKRDYPDICTTPIDEVTPLQLIEWRDDRLESVKPASVSREHNLLSAVFTYAIKEMQLIQVNPFSKVTKPKTSEPRHRRVSQEEVDIICRASGYEVGKAPKTKTQQVAWSFIFAIMTAMRASEITSITWENISLDRRFVRLPNTKNGTVREVPLLNAAVQHIELMRGIDETNLLTINASTLSTMFRTIRNGTILKDADLRFHDSRHEACTQLAKKFAFQDLAKVTGHKDLKILLNVYYNITGEELADKLNG